MDNASNTQMETRERIVTTAQALFHEKGYCSVGIAEICTKADVVKGSLYHFFPSKSDLSRAVLEKNWDVLQGHLAALKTLEISGREKLQHFFDGIVSGALAMQEEYGRILGCNLGTLASELATSDNAVKIYSARCLAAWKENIVELVREGQKDGSISPALDRIATAEAMLALTQGMSVLGRAFNDIQTLKRIADQALKLVPAPDAS